ncbi:hypothetical protein [Tenuibacillus multivorans]|uniref:Uncharacterized protein n=1 Tax=Tenuibacillus multivorans TaxID=237069 RepID=A0A1G9YG95_9BACI|nr:hypothetical protein [Tenuibacillus multivorans]GEL78547.1 hypothetical protein TMU01_27820 [Tenuibacillus multivorans]SDN07521.1 hypothetical protein SAMN05216498_1366 [Tenuibacillus multivorans]
MQPKHKALLVGIIGVVVLAGIILYSTYVGLKENPDRVQQVKEGAEQYLSENFDESYEIVDTLHDNVSVYDQFNYAAIVESDQEDFQFLVYEHSETGEYMDSYVAETWEYELESFLKPLLHEAYDENNIKELWMTFPKDIEHQLNIDKNNIPPLEENDLNPIIRLTLDRGEKDQDEAKLDQIIEQIQEEFNISSGHVTLAFNDSALFFKDSNILKEF